MLTTAEPAARRWASDSEETDSDQQQQALELPVLTHFTLDDGTLLTGTPTTSIETLMRVWDIAERGCTNPLTGNCRVYLVICYHIARCPDAPENLRQEALQMTTNIMYTQ